MLSYSIGIIPASDRQRAMAPLTMVGCRHQYDIAFALVRAFLKRAVTFLAGEVGIRLHLARGSMDLGESRRSALIELRERNESEVLGRFVASLLQAEELGTPLADTLTQISDEMRREAAALARQRAAKAAPRVSLVVTLIIVPAALLLMVTGLLIGTDFSLELFDA
jgi:tight adherence protein C